MKTKRKKEKQKKISKKTEQRCDWRVDREMHRIETTRVEVLKIIRAVEKRSGLEKPGKNKIVSQMCINGKDRNKRRNGQAEEQQIDKGRKWKMPGNDGKWREMTGIKV